MGELMVWHCGSVLCGSKVYSFFQCVLASFRTSLFNGPYRTPTPVCLFLIENSHVLHDVALPIFWALESLLPQTPLEVDANEHSGCYRRQANRGAKSDVVILLLGEGTSAHDNWLASVTARPVLRHADATCFLCPPGAWCVKSQCFFCVS